MHPLHRLLTYCQPRQGRLLVLGLALFLMGKGAHNLWQAATQHGPARYWVTPGYSDDFSPDYGPGEWMIIPEREFRHSAHVGAALAFSMAGLMLYAVRRSWNCPESHWPHGDY